MGLRPRKRVAKFTQGGEMDQTTPTLGKLLPPSERRRDAIHMAVAPCVAAETLSPGAHVGFWERGNMEVVGEMPSEKCFGIVDPFLREAVKPGDRFWVFIYPNTITSLRHVWTHPAFIQAYREGNDERA